MNRMIRLWVVVNRMIMVIEKDVQLYGKLHLVLKHLQVPTKEMIAGWTPA